MFNNLFGFINSERAKKKDEYYQKKLAVLFRTPEGEEVLIWLMRNHMININNTSKLTPHEMAYYNGQHDFIRSLIKITDMDLNKYFEKVNHGSIESIDS